MEYFDIVDSRNNVIGKASRSECHSNPKLIHRAVHVLVFNKLGELFLQKRSAAKDIQPGKWDTSVGGHLNCGESYIDAAVREAKEELGIDLEDPVFMYSYLHTNELETEWISSYCIIHEGPFCLCPVEIDTGEFRSVTKIENDNPDIYTPNFLEELNYYKNWINDNKHIFNNLNLMQKEETSNE